MIERFVKFLKEYADDEGNQIYLNKIRDILTVIPRRSIGISWEHLNAFDPELAEELLESPEEVILAAEDAIQIILQEEFFRKEPFKIHARFFELPKTYLVKELGSEHINKLIQVEGIITRITEVKPFVSRAVYVCKDCGQEMIRLQKPFATLIKPNKCEACGSRNLELDVDKSTFLNFQSFRLQDRPESLKGGQMPRFVDVILLDDLVDIALPGDRVIITGVMRVVLEQKDKRPIFRKIIEANYIEQLSKEIEELEITPEDEQKIKELAKRKDVVDVIVDSIAPAIYGMKKEKLGIALALFGGTTRQLPDGTRLRGESHVLLVGDPGVAKCVDYHTHVVLGDGRIKKIGEIVEEAIKNAEEKGKLGRVNDGVYAPINLELYALNSKTLKVEKVKADVAWKRNAPERMFKIKTATGREINVTPTHPFFVFEDGSFKTRKARELKPGDFIATPRMLAIEGIKIRLWDIDIEKPKTGKKRLMLPEFADERFWYVMGLLTGEGYAQKKNGSATIFFTNNDEELINIVYSYFEEIGLNPTVRMPHTGKRSKEVYVSSVELYRLLEHFEIAGDSSTKKVPPQLFGARLPDIRSFLRGYFDAEATVDKNRAKITVVSASNELLRGIQSLLLRFGIISQLHETKGIATNGKMQEAKKYYRLFITGEDVLKFRTNIGFAVKRKLELLEKVTSKKNFNPNIDVVPGVSKLLKDLRISAGLMQREMGINRSTYLHYERGDRSPSREKLKLIVEALEERLPAESETVRLLKLLADSDIFWDRVVEIEEYIPDHPWVYDLQVPEHHNFIANNIFVHNSQLLRYVSNLAPRAIYTSGKSSSAAGLTAAAVRDELTGSWVLEAGVLVLADMGIALIDEIDKMSDRDRSAIHEALEQQSYHKDFEIFLANGQKVKIGQFVDKLIEENRDNVIIGKDTEILPVNDVYLLAYDLEKKEVIKVKADRVSRHKAPKEFIKLRFSNGREIKVTPEHPIMVWEDGGIKEKPAEKIERDDIVIGVVGYSFEGSSEGGKDLALSLFSEKNPFRFKKGIQIPERVFTLKEEELKEFVQVIWERRKCKLNGRECIRIPTRKMAEDLQDILYILGVPTKLREIRPAYSLIPYTTRGIRRLSEILGEKVMNDETEYFPGDIAKELIKSARLIGVRVSINERNKLTRTITKREHVESLLKRVKEKIEDLQKSLKTNPVETLEVLPQSYVYWRYRISKNKLRQLVIKNDPWALRILSSEIETRVEEVRNIVMKVKELMERNILFLKVIRVERVPNTDSEWVYDVTVEPYHLFVSHGLVLHNTVSISKAGITATLNARTTVIAAANPKYGRFNRMKSLPEQLDLPPTLLSRFDLIFVLLDEPDEKFDSEIAEHILKVRKGEAELVAPKVPYDLLKKYIAYARKNVQPILSKEAMEEIKRYYVKMRRTIGRGSESEGIKPIPITARQLEALIRLSEAHARMRLSEVVTKEDAKAAIELVEYTLRRTAMDEEGNIDVSILEVGKSSRKINKMDRVLSIIKELQDLEDYGAPRDDVIKEASRQGISRTETEKIIEELKANSMIYEPRSGYYKVL